MNGKITVTLPRAAVNEVYLRCEIPGLKDAIDVGRRAPHGGYESGLAISMPHEMASRLRKWFKAQGDLLVAQADPATRCQGEVCSEAAVLIQRAIKRWEDSQRRYRINERGEVMDRS
jgi:hypothetical protein